MKTTTQTKEAEQVEAFGTEVNRALIFSKIAQQALEIIRDHGVPRRVRIFDLFCKETIKELDRIIRKLDWFVGATVNKLPIEAKAGWVAPPDPDSPRFSNIAELSEWVIRSPVDVDNQVNLIVNAAQRRQLMYKAWEAALGRDLMEYEEQRFNAWYNANFYQGDKPIIHSPNLSIQK